MGEKRKKKSKEKELPGGIENILINKRINEGNKLYGQGRYIEAIEEFSKALGKSDNHEARKNLAKCYYKLEKYEKAYKHFSYLAEKADDKMKNYGASMIAAVEIVWGNYSQAIKILKKLPKTHYNLLNLSLIYWKKYKSFNEDYAIIEAMRCLNKIDLSQFSNVYKEKVYHLKGLIYQTQNDNRLSESFYNKALKVATDEIAQGRILNDYASLHIELEDYDAARELLTKARTLVLDKSKIEEAFNDKWLGMLAYKEDELEDCKFHLSKAARVLRDKDLIEEAAGIEFFLSKIARDEDFYKSAEYFASGLYFEKLSEEVEERDEKVIDFYINSVTADHDDDSSPS